MSNSYTLKSGGGGGDLLVCLAFEDIQQFICGGLPFPRDIEKHVLKLTKMRSCT